MCAGHIYKRRPSLLKSKGEKLEKLFAAWHGDRTREMLAVALNHQFGTLTGGASQVGPQVWSFVKAAKENCYSVQYCSSCREPGKWGPVYS